MSAPYSTYSSPLPVIHALDIDDILELILSEVGTQEITKFRAVSHRWNDVIVRMLSKPGNSYCVQLRYGTEVPLLLVEADAERYAAEVLENAMKTLTGTATSLPFDAVLIQDDFYLAGASLQWQQFLEMFGHSIKHLKFRVRTEQEPGENMHHVTDCDLIVSRENLKTAFYAVPNLESLDFSVRFANYDCEEPRNILQLMFPRGNESEYPNSNLQMMFPRVTDLPQLLKLTKVTVQEPYNISYIPGFLEEIIGMAPNLSALVIRWTRYLQSFTSVVKGFPDLGKSLTSLGICNAGGLKNVREFEIDQYFRFRFLTTLELDNFHTRTQAPNIEGFLVLLHSTLNTLKLGNRKRMDTEEGGPLLGYNGFPVPDNRSDVLVSVPLVFPPIMESLKKLEVNLAKFKLARIESYSTQFPALEYLTFTCCEGTAWQWDTYHFALNHLLPGVLGQSKAVKKFSLLGPIRASARDVIHYAVQNTFPSADQFYGL